MKIFGNQIRWTDPEHEVWKREQSAKYGWGGSNSVWTVKFMLLILCMVIIAAAVLFAELKLLHGYKF